jgi:hypothetical protein
VFRESVSHLPFEAERSGLQKVYLVDRFSNRSASAPVRISDGATLLATVTWIRREQQAMNHSQLHFFRDCAGGRGGVDDLTILRAR